ncbi:RNA polymerase factor sigma-54 [Ventosimonas gracilis]|uniref:RNA polymerase sigma-54 factor n=1 Tax=Ventosimonas gracilis TaxID=1680762 RepID=A0A139SS45_9GAMM|nr:RNA polymerase factor sigma-54 [Ventosimonas gracilis]KXU37300.1 RNA polymerase factor sigma-54 [Ventosimonas gracilis]
MKPSLVLKMGQQLAMTPQLQQAIRLLQLSSLDLQQEIQQALESNPMLEREEDDSVPPPSEQELSSGAVGAESESREHDHDSSAAAEEWAEQIPTELPTDSQWDDVYQSSSGTSSGEDDWDFSARASEAEGLQEHLLWQLNLAPMSDKDRLIALVLIDSINPQGYLEAELAELLAAFDKELDVEADEIEAVLHRIQQFEPTGVGARNLSECLLLQLRQLADDTPWLKQAQRLVKEGLDALGSRDFAQLKRRFKLSQEALEQVIALIQTLNPKPGLQIEQGEAGYVVPDILVRKQGNHYTVDLNPETLPRLRVNAQYAGFAKAGGNGSDGTYMKGQLQEARWFIKSLQSRNETLLKVARQIVKAQRAFFDQGEEAMKPMVLQDIAEVVGMHESTISRVTAQKYMHTPRGIYELKYFFSSHVATAAGGECSSTAIRALIKKLVAAENSKKPLSDSKIAGLLEDQGIVVARRTIAKYREALGIAPSSERKRLI